MESKILIGIPTAEFGKQAEFQDHFDQMVKPPGSIVTRSHSQSPARNRNLIIGQAESHKCTHVLFIDDDVIVPPNLLIQLLSHDVDIVTGLYLMRNFPHQPIIFGQADNDGKAIHYYPKKEDKGLVKIVAAGLGACLINMKVFKALEKPYIRLGELEADHWCDDLGFFKRVREAGFEMYCDLDCTLQHFASVKVYPERDAEGKWFVTYNTNGNGNVSFPAIVP